MYNDVNGAWNEARVQSVHSVEGNGENTGEGVERERNHGKFKKGAPKVSRTSKSSNAGNTRGPAAGGKKPNSGFKVSKPLKSSTVSSNKGPASGGKKQTVSIKSSAVKSASKLNVVGFRGRSSSSNKNGSFRAS